MNLQKAQKLFCIVEAIATQSKDPSTQVGALFLGPQHEPLAWGYNGSPRGCSADEDARSQIRPEKYYWLEHAERNAIYNATLAGVRLLGSSLIITHPPCMDCARGIVQAGTKEVFFPQPSADYLSRWAAHFDRTLNLFAECRVHFELL